MEMSAHLEGNQNKNSQLPSDQILQQIEISRAFFSPVLHGEKWGKFQFVVEIAHKAILILICL